jgi:DNA-binding transcriptional LysR family regulator
LHLSRAGCAAIDGQPTIEELKAFVAVADNGSFAGSGKILARDGSVLSRRVSQLEAKLGVRLLSRTTRSISLTETGEIYLHRVRPLLEELAEAGNEAAEHASSPQGLVRVSLPTTFGQHWISPLLPDFLKRYPKIRLDLRLSDRLVDVVADGFDVAIRVTAAEQPDSSLTSRRIASYRNVLVASPSYVATNGDLQSPLQLIEHQCLGFTGIATWPEWQLTNGDDNVTVRPNCPLIADNSEVLLTAAIAGAGIVLLPDWLSNAALRSGELVVILPLWSSRVAGGVFAVTPPGRMLATKTRLFLEALGASLPNDWINRRSE